MCDDTLVWVILCWVTLVPFVVGAFVLWRCSERDKREF